MPTILITGANGNLGAITTQTLWQKGFKIYATSGSSGDLDKLRTTTTDVRQVDLLNEQTTATYIQDIIRQEPQLTTAILLVGGFTLGNIQDTSTLDIDQQIALNFKTAYHVIRPFMAHLEKAGSGRIILIGARPALTPTAGKSMVAYALSKGLIFHLAELINEQGKKNNITATVIVPSTIDTPANRLAMPDIDPDKWVKPEAIAETIAFLLSEAGMNLREGVLKMYNQA